MRIEETILASLFIHEEYTRQVIPHISAEYFSERPDRFVFEEFESYFTKYNVLPSKETILVQLTQKTGISDAELKTASDRVKSFSEDKKKLEWLVDKTEKFCKDRAVYNAIMRAIVILDGKDKTHSKDDIPSLLQGALGVSFDVSVGHSYLDDAEARFEFYTRVEERIPFDIELLNKITGGGIAKKTLSLILAESGGGKSLAMTHIASAALRAGFNVLYITLEMAEEKIAERVDANLLNIEINKIKDLGKDAFVTKVNNIAAKTHGRLFVKQYPTGAAHAGHFRGLLRECKTKQNFVPDLILVDYLAICASSRVKMGGSVNSYVLLKCVAEELRGLAVEENVAVISGAQLNRNGYGSSDVELTDTSESMGIVHTADLMLALINTEELAAMNQIMVKQLKNRYADLNEDRRFVVGINRSKMKLFDLEAIAQSSFKKQEQGAATRFTPDSLDKEAAGSISSDQFDGLVISKGRELSFSDFEM